MTTEQKYAEVLKALGAVLLDKDIAISCKDHNLQIVAEKLATAEAERDRLRGMITKHLVNINAIIFDCVDFETKKITDAEKLIALQGDIQRILKLAESNGGAA